MYYALGLRDLLSTTKVNLEFFDELDTFQIHFIDMVFKQVLETQMGMLNEVEYHNYEVFEEYKIQKIEDIYGVNPESFKKAG